MSQTQAFGRGTVVLLTLTAPREKFWGAILDLTPAGVSVRGVELNSFADFAQQLRSDEPVSPAVMFFPMHRVERMEMDAPSGLIPSLAEQFEMKSGKTVASVLGLARAESGGGGA